LAASLVISVLFLVILCVDENFEGLSDWARISTDLRTAPIARCAGSGRDSEGLGLDFNKPDSAKLRNQKMHGI
jgi:hypothetical protein